MVAGDVESVSTIPLEGVNKVVFAASAATYLAAKKVDYQGVVNTIEAAKAANVDSFVLVSSRLVNPVNNWHPIRIILNNIKWGLMDCKFKGEEALRGAGLPSYTIVRPGGLVGGYVARFGAHAAPFSPVTCPPRPPSGRYSQICSS